MSLNRRIIYRKSGGTEVIDLIEEKLPEPEPNEVLVRVEAIGVAFADLVMRNGLYHKQPSFPMTPGYDVCGRVEAVGEKAAEHFSKGQRVAGLTVFGSYADFTCVDHSHLVAVPEDLDAAQVTALCLNYVTAWQMLHRYAAVEKGDTILVHAAGGGVL